MQKISTRPTKRSPNEEAERQALIRKLRGKYAFTKSSSEEFARKKQEEIELEEHARNNRSY